jgi:hypothetical protein
MYSTAAAAAAADAIVATKNLSCCYAVRTSQLGIERSKSQTFTECYFRQEVGSGKVAVSPTLSLAIQIELGSRGDVANVVNRTKFHVDDWRDLNVTGRSTFACSMRKQSRP